MSINVYDLEKLMVNTLGMYAGFMLSNYFYHCCLSRRAELEGNLTFSGAVMYANKMEG